ncbi:MAG: Ig-like domain-containing protein [Gemmatimonadales bacterium]
MRTTRVAPLPLLAALTVVCGDPNDPASRAVAVEILSAPLVALVDDTLALTAQALDADGRVVSDVPFTWSSSDPVVLTVDSAGGRVVGQARGQAFVVVRVPSSAADSVTALIQPRPASLVVAAGNGQQGIMHNPLPLPIELLLTAEDGSGVRGVGLALSVTGGGSTDPFAVTDSAGRARVTWTMGSEGNQSLRAVTQTREALEANAAATSLVPGVWTWVGGDSVPNASGVHGSMGVASDDTWPGGRIRGAHWVGPDGAFWLFGGFGHDGVGDSGWLNDLWRFDGTRWTWIAGSNGSNKAGVYGSKGVPSTGNAPGGRRNAAGWMDDDGTIWIFGGNGFDAALTIPPGPLNDLWRFDGMAWTWMAGDSLVRGPGVFGTRGVANAANTPSARFGAASWTDQDGRHWLVRPWR